jgi:hypothetical protein
MSMDERCGLSITYQAIIFDRIRHEQFAGATSIKIAGLRRSSEFHQGKHVGLAELNERLFAERGDQAADPQ